MNNRQANNGRRRGRGGQQRPGGGSPNQRDNGNRIDNRARGNAAQLLEKYKNLARDAQMQGDRVNAEYYFQFADHYFRVLSETRSRFEENNPGASRRPHEDSEDEDFEYEAEGNRDQPRDRDRDQPRDQQQRAERDDRDRDYQGGQRDGNRDNNRNGRANGNGGYVEPEPFEARGEAETFQPRDDAEQGQRRGRGRPRRDAGEDRVESHGIDAAILPPALSVEAAAEPEDKPRRRGRPRRDAELPQG